jgi:hypothetical protein
MPTVIMSTTFRLQGRLLSKVLLAARIHARSPVMASTFVEIKGRLGAARHFH